MSSGDAGYERTIAPFFQLKRFVSGVGVGCGVGVPGEPEASGDAGPAGEADSLGAALGVAGGASDATVELS